MSHSSTQSLADEHWWGFAALPDGVDYPENGEDNPLTLICQFHHGDGMVSVLADLDYFFGDYDAPNGGMGSWHESFYKVIYSPDRSHLNEHAIRYADGSSAVPEAEPMDAPLKRGEVSHIWGEPSYFTDEVAQDYQTRIAPAESLVWQWQHHTNVRNTPEAMAAPNANP